jgi:hypothetical protein
MIKRLVCLANSRKSGGRCIAGRELLTGNLGEWIRPVSDRKNEESQRMNGNTKMAETHAC